MTIAEYQTLTGITVPAADVNRIKAIIHKAETKLEGSLGYSLSNQKTWTELGKVQYNGLVPFPSLPIGDDVLNNLGTADDQTGEIQLFNFNELDKHIKINPAEEIYRAKIVLPVSQDEFVTICDLEDISPYLNSTGLVTAITRSNSWFAWNWWVSLTPANVSSLMIAVDADYVDICDVSCCPDIAYLLADMVTYYSDPSYSVMGNIRSESIDSHSYTRGPVNSKATSSAPEEQPSAKRIIEKYAGPGAFRNIVQ